MLRRILRKLRGDLGTSVKKGNRIRRELSWRYLRGAGIEVGALHAPLPVSGEARVTYVDRMPVDDLRKHYPELNGLDLVPVDVVDDGERLDTFQAASQAFVVSNHFLEHTQDPIRTLKRHVEVLAPGGKLYLAIPDKRLTFDSERPETTLEHLIQDHERGPEGSYRDHLREYAEKVEKCQPKDLEARVDQLAATNYSIHFHVWSEHSFRRFVNFMIDVQGLPARLIEMRGNPLRQECIAILERT